MSVFKNFLTNKQILQRAYATHCAIVRAQQSYNGRPHINLYGVPRGGIPAAYAIFSQHPSGYLVVDNPEEAHVIIDDIIDSGATRSRYTKLYPDKMFFALVDKDQEPDIGWVVFPWEAKNGQDAEGIQDNIRRILQFIEPSTSEREGLQDTPKRVEKAWKEWTRGYSLDAASILKVFGDGAEGCDEMVVVKNIPVYSKCEHHLADIFGTATVAYIPNGKVVGLSKLSRIVDMYAKRLQVQERLTNQIANALEQHLGALGVGVVIKARHMCMESRGIRQQGHHTVTSALRGKMKDQPETRAEFMAIMNSSD